MVPDVAENATFGIVIGTFFVVFHCFLSILFYLCNRKSLGKRAWSYGKSFGKRAWLKEMRVNRTNNDKKTRNDIDR